MKHGDFVIKPPNFKIEEIKIIGTSPMVQNAFSQKAKEKMKETQKQGSQSKKGKARQAKNFVEAYEEAKHISKEGWAGIPASALRAGMVSACRLVNFKMTISKMAVFVEADGFDRRDGTPLIKIIKGDAHYIEHSVTVGQGTTDIRPRPMWDEGWEAMVRIKYDADLFTEVDIRNLLIRVGQQVGIGEGRADSRKTVGMGWGFFELGK